MQHDEKKPENGPGIVESTVFTKRDTPGQVDLKLLNDTPGCVGINTREGRQTKRLKKAETTKIFEKRSKDGRRKEIQKKFKKTLKKVLRFSGLSNIMQKMSAKGMKWQIAHWPVR